jgi:two-component system chemotaxis response regulator CheB
VPQALNAERTPRDVIVLGASAGGVLPLRDLLAKLPADINAAIALVLHRSPAVESKLAAVLGGRSGIPVVEAVDGSMLQAGVVHVAPRDHHLRIDGSTLRLSRGPKEHHTRPAIDPLFTSAAASHGRRVVGVLLSGTGDDGVAGLISITAARGLSLVQHPDEAMFPQMPRSAIVNDRVEAALPVSEIAETLAALARGESVVRVEQSA